MRRHWKKLALLMAAVAAVGTAAFLGLRGNIGPVSIGQREPTYKGRQLSEWVTMFNKGRHVEGSKEEAAEAVRSIGTNAVPWLLSWITYQRPRWRQEAITAAYRLRDRIGTDLRAVELVSDMDRIWGADNATEAFRYLGALGASAAPELVRLTRITNSPFIPAKAGSALAFIGPAALPTITAELSNPAYGCNDHLGRAIAMIGPPAKPLVPLLVQNLRYTNEVAATSAAWTLGSPLVGVQPWDTAPPLDVSNSVPALVRALSDPREAVRGAAAQSLGSLKEAARPALTALSKMAASDPDMFGKMHAADAIENITHPRTYTAPPSH